MGQAPIVVSTAPLPDWLSIPEEWSLRIARDASVERVRECLDASVVALIARSSTPVGVELMEAAPSLRVIGRTGAGYDSIDVSEATRRGILVLYTPQALTRPTAEHTASLILAAAKQIPQWHRRVVEGCWRERDRVLNFDLCDASLGIVGFGRIGREVARLLSTFVAQVLACDPLLAPDDIRQAGAQPVAFEEILGRSDILSLHAPLTERTRSMINAESLSRIKPGSILVNAARGGLVADHRCLIEALDSGRLRCVALDPLSQEPPSPEDPLLRHPGVILTPHVGARTPRTQRDILEMLLKDLFAFLGGGDPNPGNVVNPEVLRS